MNITGLLTCHEIIHITTSSQEHIHTQDKSTHIL